MSPARLIEQHSKLVGAARNGAEILDYTRDAVGELGFDRVTIVHAQWFVRTGSQLIFLHNFGGWSEVFIERRYYRSDPALLLSQRCNRPFTWAEMLRRLGPHPMRSRTLRQAGHHGLRLDLTVPVTFPGERCSLATDASELPCATYRCAAAAIAEEAFEEARRLHGYSAPIDKTVTRLPPRKFECLRWAVIGRTDERIALIMGAKVSTMARGTAVVSETN